MLEKSAVSPYGLCSKYHNSDTYCLKSTGALQACIKQSDILHLSSPTFARKIQWKESPTILNLIT